MFPLFFFSFCGVDGDVAAFFIVWGKKGGKETNYPNAAVKTGVRRGKTVDTGDIKKAGGFFPPQVLFAKIKKGFSPLLRFFSLRGCKRRVVKGSWRWKEEEEEAVCLVAATLDRGEREEEDWLGWLSPLFPFLHGLSQLGEPLWWGGKEEEGGQLNYNNSPFSFYSPFFRGPK